MGNVMNTKLKSNIYLCKKLTATTWGEPVIYRFNIFQVNSSTKTEEYGTNFTSDLKIMCTTDESVLFSVGDKIYYKKTPPTTHNNLQNKKADSNYMIKQLPVIGLNFCKVYLNNIKGR